MAHEKPTDSYKLHDLPPDFEWCTVGAQGIIWLKTVRGSKPTGTSKTILSVPARIALSLNARCCERGFGRFYLLTPPPDLPNMRSAPISEWKAYMMSTRAGELFYAHEGWTSESQDQYRRMTAVKKVHRLRSQTGYIADDVPGLMIGTHYDNEQNCWPKFNGATQAPVTLLITPRPYIGLTEDLVHHCRRVYRVTTDGRPVRCFWEGLGDNWSNFTQWQATGLDDILDKVSQIYSTADDAMMCFGTARAMVLQDKQEASKIGAVQY